MENPQHLDPRRAWQNSRYSAASVPPVFTAAAMKPDCDSVQCLLGCLTGQIGHTKGADKRSNGTNRATQIRSPSQTFFKIMLHVLRKKALVIELNHWLILEIL
jgi:hypothetical protein